MSGCPCKIINKKGASTCLIENVWWCGKKYFKGNYAISTDIGIARIRSRTDSRELKMLKILLLVIGVRDILQTFIAAASGAMQ